MKNNIFSYWDYDSIECKPKREPTTLGAIAIVLTGAVISGALFYGVLWLAALWQISSSSR